MSYPNSGSLFTNDKKVAGTNQKDSNGSGELTCQHCGEVNVFWIAGWRKVSQNGKKFLSMAFQPKEPVAKPEAAEGEEEYDSDVPF